MTVALPIEEPLWVVLVFVRVAAVLIVAPLFGHPALSMRIRAGLALAVSLALAPGVSVGRELPESLVAVVICEFAVGAAIGFCASLVFAAIGFMAEVISLQGGLGAAAALDPTSEASSVVVAAMLRTFALLLFLAIGGHHEVIRATWLSFERVPLGGPIAIDSFREIAALGSFVFETGFRLAAPLTVVLLVANLVVGALGRMIPQFNLISLQLPAQVALTLLMIGIGAGVMVDSIGGVLQGGLEQAVGVVLGVG